MTALSTYSYSSEKSFMERCTMTLSRIENRLSYISQTPFIGIAPGIAKLAIGILQTVIAGPGTAVGLCARVFGNKEILAYSFDHLRNGLGNIAAGTLESIPFAGTALWNLRKDRCRRQIRTSLLRQVTPENHQQQTQNQAASNIEPLVDLNMDRIFADLRKIESSTFIKFQTYRTLSHG